MKKLIKTILISTSLVTCGDSEKLPRLDSSKLEKVTHETPDGKEIVSYYHDTIRHGSYEKYKKTGKLNRKGYYYNDSMTGRWEFYDSLGNLHEVRYYHQSMINGADTVYYPNGKLRRTGYYNSGHEEGPWQYYTQDGQLKSEITYVDGLPKEDSYVKYDTTGDPSKN